MTRVVAFAGRITAHLFTSTLTACAVLALTAISDGGAQSFAQTPPPPAPAAAAPAAPKLDAQQLDQLTAPIAAYPDPLLAQVLMAATFPDDVIAAAAWSKDHPELKGDDAVKAVASMPWDPSVQSLVAFPQALATMAQNPNWVDAIGQAFLAQSSDVMDSVQRLRQAAYKAGNLKTSEQQKIEVQPTTNTIVIQPANPQVVYVPTYNPTTFYGPWPYAAYPPTYLPPPPGYAVGTALAAGLAFGTGIAITNALWGGCDWGRGDVNVNVNRYNNINVNNRINANRSTSNWDRTNAVNNRNRMQANGNRPGGLNNGRPGGVGGANGRPGGPGGAADRNAYRGRDNAQRDQARQTLSQRTGQNMNGSAGERVNSIRQGGGANTGARGGQAGARAGGGAAAANRGGAVGADRGANRANIGNEAHNMNRDSALRDAGNGNASRQSMERGQQSHARANAQAGGGLGNRPNNAGAARPAGGGGHAGGFGGGGGGGGGARAGGHVGGGGGGGGGMGHGGGGGGGFRRH